MNDIRSKLVALGCAVGNLEVIGGELNDAVLAGIKERDERITRLEECVRTWICNGETCIVSGEVAKAMRLSGPCGDESCLLCSSIALLTPAKMTEADDIEETLRRR